jgi:hypothetical protein
VRLKNGKRRKKFRNGSKGSIAALFNVVQSSMLFKVQCCSKFKMVQGSTWFKVQMARCSSILSLTVLNIERQRQLNSEAIEP